MENRMHDWQNDDFSGTRGWYKCARCGYRTHAKQPSEGNWPPAPDVKVHYPLKTCDEMVEYKVTAMVKAVEKALTSADADTSHIRKLVGESLVGC